MQFLLGLIIVVGLFRALRKIWWIIALIFVIIVIMSNLSGCSSQSQNIEHAAGQTLYDSKIQINVPIYKVSF